MVKPEQELLMIGNLVTFILCAGVGFALIRYSRELVKLFGRNAWAEDKFGAGGSNTLWKIIGVSVATIGLLTLTGDFQALMIGLARLFIN